MEELSLSTLFAVFEEMFGAMLFWSLAAAAVLVTIAFVYVLIRDRGFDGRRLLRAELAAPVGAVAAVMFVLWMTNSHLRDMGGPIDWIVLLGIAVAGAVGLTLLVYVAQALIAGRRAEQS